MCDYTFHIAQFRGQADELCVSSLSCLTWSLVVIKRENQVGTKRERADLMLVIQKGSPHKPATMIRHGYHHVFPSILNFWNKQLVSQQSSIRSLTSDVCPSVCQQGWHKLRSLVPGVPYQTCGHLKGVMQGMPKIRSLHINFWILWAKVESSHHKPWDKQMPIKQ